MGQYQGRTPAQGKASEEADDRGLRNIGGGGGEDTAYPQTPDQAPPVFGSPIDTESYLASLPTDTSMPKSLQDLEPMSVMSKEETREKRKIPIVFRWDSGGNDVFVCGDFNNWETKVPLTNSHGDFTSIVELPEGRHEYKFFVDGQWLHDPNDAAVDNGLGSYNNVVEVSKKDFDAYYETWDITSSAKDSSPPGSYSQMMPPRSSTLGLPPHLPPLLQQTILNLEQPSVEDPTLLPEPNHVILNHLYALSIKDNVLVVSATHRYKQKYVTTLMYKPV